MDGGNLILRKSPKGFLLGNVIDSFLEKINMEIYKGYKQKSIGSSGIFS